MRYSIVFIIVCFLSFVPAKAQTDNNDPIFIKPDAVSPGLAEERANQSALLGAKAKELAQSQHFEEAKVLFEQASKFDPNQNSIIVHSNYGKMLIDWGKPNEAIQEYNKALSFDPAYEIAEINIANCFYKAIRNRTGKILPKEMHF